MLLGASMALGGCGTAPAHPVRGTGPALTLPLNGDYDVTLHTPWVGPVSTHFTAAPTEEGFKANTRPGVAWSMIGGVEGFLGPAFAPFLFPSGMILNSDQHRPHDRQARRGHHRHRPTPRPPCPHQDDRF